MEREVRGRVMRAVTRQLIQVLTTSPAEPLGYELQVPEEGSVEEEAEYRVPTVGKLNPRVLSVLGVGAGRLHRANTSPYFSST